MLPVVRCPAWAKSMTPTAVLFAAQMHSLAVVVEVESIPERTPCVKVAGKSVDPLKKPAACTGASGVVVPNPAPAVVICMGTARPVLKLKNAPAQLKRIIRKNV